MIFANVRKQVEVFVRENSHDILTGVGVAGTVATAVLTGRSTIKAVELVQKDIEDGTFEDMGSVIVPQPSKTEIVKLVWPVYIPPVAVGSVTIGSIVMANRISSRTAAAMAAAYGLSEHRFKEYKDKVAEKVGLNKDQAIRDEIAHDQVAQGSEIIITGDGNVLCFDQFTGRFFESTMESIKRAENRVNEQILSGGSASLSDFYDELGIAATTLSDTIGWNSHTTGLVDLKFSTVMSKDNRPCIAIDFTGAPIYDFTKNY